MACSDALLVQRWVRERDADAFRDLVERYSRMVYATARRILGDSHEADDVTQECFLRLAQASMPERACLGAWLHRIATNLAISLVRSQRRRRRRTRTPPPAPDVAEELAWSEIQGIVDEAIAALPDPQRIPLVEHFFHGRTYTDIANDFELSDDAIAYRVRAGVEGIRRLLERRGIHASASVLAVQLTALATASASPLPESLHAGLLKMAVAGPGVYGAATALGASSVSSASSSDAKASPEARPTTVLSPVAMKMGMALVVSAVVSVGAWAYMYRAASDPQSGQSGGTSGGTVASPLSEKTRGNTRHAPVVPTEVAHEVPQATEPPEEAVPRGLIGHVVDEAGEPVPDAEVFLALHPESPSLRPSVLKEGLLDQDYWQYEACFLTLSDGAGQFVIEGIPEKGVASLIARYGDHWASSRLLRLEEQREGGHVTLSLRPGISVRGTVLSRAGRPVPDAVVSVYYARNDQRVFTNAEFADVLTSPAFGVTAEDGSFELTVDAQVTHVTLRVNSDSLGQQFFLELPVRDGDLRIQFREWASVRGRIVRGDGRPAVGELVCVHTSVPEPGTRFEAGTRAPPASLVICSEVGQSGSYEITELQPDFVFSVNCGPHGGGRFLLGVGETKEWNATIGPSIRIRGTVLTAASRRPVPHMKIVVSKKGGTPRWTGGAETDEGGAYELVVNTGPGDYRIVATPEQTSTYHAITELIAERLGKKLTLIGGEELEVNLEIDEPIQIPVRVRDEEGRPAKSFRSSLSFWVSTAGSGFGRDSRHQLDRDGRHVFRIYHPVDHFALTISTPSGVCCASIKRTAPEVGTLLPEVVVDFPPTCNLRGVLKNAAGEPCAGERVRIRAIYAGDSDESLCSSESFSCRADAGGGFTEKHRLRAAPVTLEISIQGGKGIWKSAPLYPWPRQTLDLGEIVLSKQSRA